MELQKLFVTLTLEAKKYANGLRSAVGEAQSAGGRIARALGDGLKRAGQLMAAGIAIGAAAIVGVSRQLIILGSDAEEMQGKFDVVFSEFGGQVTQDLDRFATEVGRSRFELRGFASTIGDTLKPMGFTEEAAAGLSTEMVKLAVDLGSFNNMETDESLQRLQSTLIGNHQNALAFGVIINENTLKAELMRMGVQNLTGTQLEQAKVQARINLLLAGTTDAQGDAARTSQSWANQQRRLNSILTDAATELGTQLLPVVTPLLSILGDMAARVVPMASDAFGGFLEPLARVSDVAQRFFERLDLGLSPTRALVGALKQAGFKDIGDNVQWLSDKFFEMKDVVMEFIQPLVDFIAENVKLQDVAIALGIALATFLLPVLASILLTIAGIVLPVLAVIAVVALLRTAWENDWGGIQGKTAEAIEFVKGFISDGLAAISAWWAEHGATVIAIVTTLFQGIVTAVTTYLGIVYTVVSTILGNIAMFWAEHGESIKEIASKAWEAIQKSVEVVTRLILGVIATFLSIITGDLEGAKKIWNDVVVETWEEIKQIFTDGIEGARKIIAETDWTTLGKNLVQGFINGITSMIGAVVDAAKDLAQAALDAIKGILDTGSPSRETHALAQMAALGMQNGLTEGTPAVAAAAGNMAQAVISAISDLDLAGKMSSVMGSFTSLFNTKEVKPLEDALKGVSKTVVDLAKETGYTADELRLMTSADLNTLGFFGVRGINEDLIDALKQESDLLSELAEKQEKLAEIERQKQDLAMLQAQQSLLDLVKDNDLNADILSGLTFGLDADLGAILAATSAAMQQMLTEAASGFGGYALASAMPMSGNGGGGSNYTANTTVNVASGDDPLRALHASRLLDKIGP